MIMADILFIIEQTGNAYKKASATKGGVWKGPCPWCGGNDRFSIYPHDGAGWYICNQCKKTGDAIQFFMDYEHLSFKQACDRAGEPEKAEQKPSKKEKPAHAWEPRTVEKPGDSWVKKSESFLFSTFKFLMSAQGKPYRDYLNNRGISNATIKSGRIGYNPAPAQFSYGAFGMSPEPDKSGKEKTVWIPDGVVIPYFDQAGRLARLRIRNANPHGRNPYVLLTGGTTEYFIYPGFDSSKKTMVVESELDGWAVWEAAGGIVNVMAAGNAQTRPDQEAADRLLNCAGVLCSFDFDDAGKAESAWWVDHFKAVWWPVPAGKDPGEAFVLGVDMAAWATIGVSGTVMDPREKTPVEPLPYLSPEPGPTEIYESVSNPEPSRVDRVPMSEPDESPQGHTPGRVSENNFQIEKIRIRHISEVTRCRDGETCIHISSGVCLVCGVPVIHVETCPRLKWWVWVDSDGIECLIMGFKKGVECGSR